MKKISEPPKISALREPVEVGGRALTIRMLTAGETLLCLVRARMLSRAWGAGDGGVPLLANALLARFCLMDGERRAFRSIRQVLAALTCAELAALAERYGLMRVAEGTDMGAWDANENFDEAMYREAGGDAFSFEKKYQKELYFAPDRMHIQDSGAVPTK